MNYILTYGRVVILKTTIEAENVHEAAKIAVQLEHDGELGIENLKAKNGSQAHDIQDYDAIWELDLE